MILDVHYVDMMLQKVVIEKNLVHSRQWKFEKVSITDKDKLNNIFCTYKPKIVINLAAQAGVRYSLEKPLEYINSNIVGFGNILEVCREFEIEHLIYASSSSVYGGNKKFPFEESHKVDNPINIYAATKVSNELMANAYCHLYKIPATGLRFFTVYGPWGRPDMAPMIFANAMLSGEPINIFNNGEMSRDFTYIDDVVDAIYKCCFKTPNSKFHYNDDLEDSTTSFLPHKIFNVGSNNPTNLLDFIEILESALGVKAIKEMKPMQPGDVKATFADISRLKKWVNFSPRTSSSEGIFKFASWYKEYFNSAYYQRK